MNFNVSNLTRTLSVDIHFDNLSLETYNKILDFIRIVEKTITTDQESVLPAERVNVSEATAPNDEWEPLTLTPPKRPEYTGGDVIRRIQKDVQKHSERYQYEWMTAKEFMKRIPELSDHKTMAIAQNLAKTFRKQRVYNKDEQKYQQEYYVPILKSDTHNNTDGKRGNILRRARLAHGLSLADLAKQIGYGIETILKWEIGEYHISQNAEECLRKVFCKDIFAEEEAAS